MCRLRFLLLAVPVSFLFACNTAPDIHYPQPLPDSTAISFMPGVVSTEALDFNSCFSPDGITFYYARSNDGQWDIYCTRFDGKQWGPQEFAPCREARYSEADPVFAPNGDLYFISNRPVDPNGMVKDFDIWFIHPLGDGKWSAPQNAKAVNSDTTEYYVSFSSNADMYFASNRPGGLGEEDLYVSKFINNQYTTPQNLGAAVNSKGSDHDPFIAGDGSYLVFTSSGRADSIGQADLYCTTPDANKQWTPARHLSKRFNTATYEYCPMLSPDGKYFFFSSEGDVKWIDAKYLLKEIAGK